MKTLKRWCLLLALSLYLAPQTGFSESSPNCLVSALKRVFSDRLDEVLFTRDVADYHFGDSTAPIKFLTALKLRFPRQKWKANLIKRIWKKEIDRGWIPIDMRERKLTPWVDNGATVMALPYALDIPKEAIDAFIGVARAKGLPRGERYLVLPLKYAATTGIHHFWSNAIVVLSLSGAGALLGFSPFLAADPLWTETDPDKIKKNEVIVLMQLGDPEAKDKDFVDAATYIDEEMMKAVSDANPKSVRYLRYNSQTSPSEKQAFFDGLKAEGKTIKKVIVVSHGSPGVVATHDSFYLLGDLGKELQSFSPPWASVPEVYFQGCSVAGNAKGENEVRRFSETMPQGATIRANRYTALAMGNRNSNFYNVGVLMPNKIKNSPPLGKAWWVYSPATAEFIPLVAGFAARVAGAIGEGDKSQLIGPTYFEMKSKGTVVHPTEVPK